MPSITDIAESYGLSSQTIRRIVKEHPELDIKLEPRKRTVLTPNQVSALCSLLDSKYRSDNVTVAPKTTATDTVQQPVGSTEESVPNTTGTSEPTLQQDTLELLQQIATLREELAYTKGQLEGRETLIKILEERNQDLESAHLAFPKLLEEGKDAARETGREQGREEGRSEEQNRWLSMSRWKRFFGGK